MMAWAKPTTITSWSFSRFKTYDQCPLKLKLSAIDKIKEPPSDAMSRGDRIHKLAEAYVKGTLKKLPDELALFPKFFNKMKNLYAKKRDMIVVEETWAFRKDWSRTVWNDWTECWLRVKLDVAWIDGSTVFIVDSKTGKFNPRYGLESYVEQLDLYATAALLIYSDVPGLKVIPALYYLDHEIIYPEPGNEKVYTLTFHGSRKSGNDA
jgi:hypothetical protein